MATVKEALSVADGAMIVLRGSAGIEVGTEKAWEYAVEADIPKMLYITEMDAPNVDIEKILLECKVKFGTSVAKGILAGYPVVGVKAILLDGSYHPVDSSEMAFKMATIVAFKEGMTKAKPTLLEPIAHVEITVPEAYTGDIMGDMKKRRGCMIGMELKGRKQMIIAEMPLSELYTYATDVRSMTQGRGEVSY